MEINAHLNELSESLSKELNTTLQEYGVSLISFYVNDINVPENDPAVKQLKAALAKRAEMDIIGYSYQQERTFDTLETAADNKGTAGAVIGSGLGLGMGFGIGNAVSAQAKNLGNTFNDPEKTKECPTCKAKISEHIKFCPECGCDTTQKSSLKCAACSAEITKTTKFCPECGAKINLCPNCGNDMGERDSCPSCGAKKCPNCGNLVRNGGKFCPECGIALVKKCSNCGAVVEDDKKFCSECGTKLSD